MTPFKNIGQSIKQAIKRRQQYNALKELKNSKERKELLIRKKEGFIEKQIHLKELGDLEGKPGYANAFIAYEKAENKELSAEAKLKAARRRAADKLLPSESGQKRR